MLRTRRFLLVLAVVGVLVAAPALTAAAAPPRAPASSWVAWLYGWLPGAFGRAGAASDTYPSADPDGAQTFPNADPDGVETYPNADPNGAQATESSPDSGGETFPSADPNG
jgi:hypothetical protein